MKKSLIAVAAAGLLASGAVAADSITLRVGGPLNPFVTVQSSEHDYRNWHEGGRQLSIDQRQARINERIARGFQSGHLTRREARQLERQLIRIEHKERAFEADGRLDRRERAELHNDLDGVATRLRFEHRDAQYRQ